MIRKLFGEILYLVAVKFFNATLVISPVDDPSFLIHVGMVVGLTFYLIVRGHVRKRRPVRIWAKQTENIQILILVIGYLINPHLFITPWLIILFTIMYWILAVEEINQRNKQEKQDREDREERLKKLRKLRDKGPYN